jgi:transcriptional antiterminator
MTTHTEQYAAATKKQQQIADLMLREDGATAPEIQKKTGESKRRSRYSLAKLAETLGYVYEAYSYDGDRYLHHFMIAKKTANVVKLPRKAKAA